MKNGRMVDVLIVDYIFDGKKVDDKFYVYADKGMEKLISTTEGVMSCISAQYEVEYVVKIDPRYDVNWVKEEIKAAILCRGEE